MKKYGFTLAEVLITLVIIGVIAALTIPNLLQKYQEQTTVKKVQKFYSNLSNAYSLALQENGSRNDWGLKGNYNAQSAAKAFEIIFKPYFKIAKDCGLTTTGNCLASGYKSFSSQTAANYNSSSTAYKFVLDDGSTIFMYMLGSDTSNSITTAYDINGKKGPNTWGIDVFHFNDNIPAGSPYGRNINDVNNSFKSSCNPNSTHNPGMACTAWLIYKGNMDYLHCDDLSWTGKDKCK